MGFPFTLTCKHRIIVGSPSKTADHGSVDTASLLGPPSGAGCATVNSPWTVLVVGVGVGVGGLDSSA